MYDSLMEHFSYNPSKSQKQYLEIDVEARMSKLSSKSTLVEVTEVLVWKPTRTELGIMITLAVCSLVYAVQPSFTDDRLIPPQGSP